MVDFKAKVKQIIDEGFTKEQIKPDLNKIAKGYYKNDMKPEKKETFDLDISMKGLKGRIQSKAQRIVQKNKKAINNKIKNSSLLDKYSSKGSTKPINSQIEIREIPTTTAASITAKGQHSTKQNLYREIIASLDASKVRNGYKSKVKKEIEAFSNSMKEPSGNTRNVLNKQPLPSIPIANEQHHTCSINKISLTSHQSFNLINHKINSILNKTNALSKPGNKKIFEINDVRNKSRPSIWTKVTLINLDNDNQKDVDDFSKSFDLKLSSTGKGKFLNKMEMDSLFNHRLRKASEDNTREKLILDF